jgi:hypothetical protein
VTDAQSAFGTSPDDVWLSCPLHRKRSAEFIGYQFDEPYYCRSVTIEAPPTERARKLAFLVEASADDFDVDIRRVHQIVLKTDGERRQFDLPEHSVAARSWRLMRLAGRSAGPLVISYLRFGADDGAPRDLDAALEKIASVRERFQYRV